MSGLFVLPPVELDSPDTAKSFLAIATCYGQTYNGKLTIKCNINDCGVCRMNQACHPAGVVYSRAERDRSSKNDQY
jgi:hypothetical protein